MPKHLNLYGKTIFKIAGKSFCAVHFSALDDETLKRVYSWRTSPGVANWMRTSCFPFQKHLDFARALKSCRDRFYWLLYDNESPVGVFYVTGIKNYTGELGLYSSPERKHVGGTLLRAVFYFAFSCLGLKELTACAYEDNVAANSLYQRFGMKRCIPTAEQAAAACPGRKMVSYNILLSHEGVEDAI